MNQQQRKEKKSTFSRGGDCCFHIKPILSTQRHQQYPQCVLPDSSYDGCMKCMHEIQIMWSQQWDQSREMIKARGKSSANVQGTRAQQKLSPEK